MRDSDGEQRDQPQVLKMRAQGRIVTYKGINFCDRCGQTLEEGRWLSGVCGGCEEKAKEHASSMKVAKDSVRKMQGKAGSLHGSSK